MNMFHWKELGLEYLVKAFTVKWEMKLGSKYLLTLKHTQWEARVRLRQPFYDTLCQCWQQLSETHITTHNYCQPGL